MNSLLSLWNRIPALIRAPVTAFLILIIAVYPISFLLQMNLEIRPSLPWAIVPGGLYIWLLWRYVGGWAAPASTSDSRKRYRRYNPLPSWGGLWLWITAGALAVTILSYAMIKLLTETGGVQQTAVIDALVPLPATTVLPLLAMLVLMTALFEEAAFRGYMQVQLEDRYTPAIAIFLTAFFFAALHFPTIESLPLFVFGSLGWGILTYLSNTILPAIVMHGAVDAVSFVWAWKNPVEFAAVVEYNAYVSGPDTIFITWATIAAVGTVCTILCFFKLASRRSDFV